MLSLDGARLEQLRDHAFQLAKDGKRGVDVIEVNAEILLLEPRDLPARARLGYAYRVVRDFDSAQAIYEGLLDLALPGSPERATAEGAIELIENERVRGGPSPSLADQLAATANSDDALARARALRDADRNDLAHSWVDRALELANGQASQIRTLAVKASILRKLRRPAEALAVIEGSLWLASSYSENEPAYVIRTACLVDLDRLSEALEIVGEYLEADHDNAYAMNAAGRALKVGSRRTGEMSLQERAERCFRRAAELEPANKQATAQLLEILESHRRAKRAREINDLERFLEGIGVDASRSADQPRRRAG